MSTPLPREKATNRADLPHVFAGVVPACETCGECANDERHISWLEQQNTGRENAAVAFSRETGT